MEKEALRTAKVRRSKAIQLGSEEFLLMPNGTKSGYRVYESMSISQPGDVLNYRPRREWLLAAIF